MNPLNPKKLLLTKWTAVKPYSQAKSLFSQPCDST
jgi:hypothetical protein